MEVKVGDVVQLKSGGPLMTVTNVKNEEAFCIWFDKSSDDGHKLTTHWFNMSSLNVRR